MSKRFRHIAVAGLTAFAAFFVTVEAEADPLVIKAPAYVPKDFGAPTAAPVARAGYPQGRWHARRAARAMHARGYGYGGYGGYGHARPVAGRYAGWSGYGHARGTHVPVVVTGPGWGDTPFRSDPKVIYNTPGGLTEIASQARRVEEIHPLQAYAPFYR
jgi:hypothetical protein